MTIAVCPGSFDPITKGHLDIIKRTSKLYDEVIIAVVHNSNKSALFSLEERIEMIEYSTKDINNVRVDYFDGLLIDYASENDINVIVKGLRAVSDFEYEFQMALMNKGINPHIETLFMMTSPKYSFLSSSLVKEVSLLGGSVDEFVTEHVNKMLAKKNNKGGY